MQTSLADGIKYQESRIARLEREKLDIEARIGEAFNALQLLQRMRDNQVSQGRDEK